MTDWKIAKEFEEKSQSKEWGAWKFVSDMLDNPDEYGIYRTSKCYEQIHDFVVELIAQARQDERNKVLELGEKLKKNSDSRSAEFEVSEDGYVSGIEDLLAQLKEK